MKLWSEHCWPNRFVSNWCPCPAGKDKFGFLYALHWIKFFCKYPCLTAVFHKALTSRENWGAANTACPLWVIGPKLFPDICPLSTLTQQRVHELSVPLGLSIERPLVNHVCQNLSWSLRGPDASSPECVTNMFGMLGTSLRNAFTTLSQTQQARTFKVVSALRRRCASCRIVRRGKKVYVLCEENPRHKQRQGKGGSVYKKISWPLVTFGISSERWSLDVQNCTQCT